MDLPIADGLPDEKDSVRNAVYRLSEDTMLRFDLQLGIFTCIVVYKAASVGAAGFPCGLIR